MRIGRTSFSPMYPMIPHILVILVVVGRWSLVVGRWSLVAGRSLPLLLLHPPVLVDLLPARDAERSGRHVFDDRRSRRDVGALPHAHRRHQLRVAADERAVLDHRLVLVRAVVIARDGSRADVHLLA